MEDHAGLTLHTPHLGPHLDMGAEFATCMVRHWGVPRVLVRAICSAPQSHEADHLSSFVQSAVPFSFAASQAVDGHLKVLKGKAAFCDERALQALQGPGKPVSLKGADAVQLHSFRKSGGAGGGHTWYLAAGTHSKDVLADWLAQVKDGQLVCLQSSSSGTPQYVATIVNGSRGIKRLPAAKR